MDTTAVNGKRGRPEKFTREVVEAFLAEAKRDDKTLKVLATEKGFSYASVIASCKRLGLAVRADKVKAESDAA